MAYMPESDAQITNDLAAGLKVISDRRPDYVDAKAYYDGDLTEMSAANPAIRKILAKSAEAHKLSFAAIPVDALFDKITITGLTIDGGDDSPAGKALAAVWAENDLEDEGDDWQRMAGVFGDYYAIIDPPDEDEDGAAMTVPDAVGKSPLSAAVVYTSKNSRDAHHGVTRWWQGDHWEALVYYQDCTVALATPVGEKDGDDATKYIANLDVDDDGSMIEGSDVVPHTGDRLLIIHFRADAKPYGKPVHRKAFGPQDAINKQHATYLAAVEYQGFPQRYALADASMSLEDDDLDDDFGTDGLPVDTDHPSTGTGADGNLKPVSGTSKLQSAPGSAWYLRGIKEVGQFDAALTDNFLKGLDWEVRAMSTATGTPFFEFDESGNPPSGVSRRLANGRINKHAAKVKASMSKSWREFGEAVLGVMGIDTKALVVTPAFDPIETETDAEGMALVSAKVLAGVSPYTALIEAGYEAKDVAEWFPENDTTRLHPALWAAFADFIQKTGTALVSQALQPSELAALVPQFLTARRDGGFEPQPAPPEPTPPGNDDPTPPVG